MIISVLVLSSVLLVLTSQTGLMRLVNRKGLANDSHSHLILYELFFLTANHKF